MSHATDAFCMLLPTLKYIYGALHYLFEKKAYRCQPNGLLWPCVCQAHDMKESKYWIVMSVFSWYVCTLCEMADVRVTLHNLFLYSDPPPTLSPTLLMAHAAFEPNLFWFRFSFLVHSPHTYLPIKMEQTECFETLAYKLQMPGNYPEESIQHTEHCESLK